MAEIQIKCPYCGNDDEKMIEKTIDYRRQGNAVTKITGFFCNVCGKGWRPTIHE